MMQQFLKKDNNANYNSSLDISENERIEYINNIKEKILNLLDNKS